MLHFLLHFFVWHQLVSAWTDQSSWLVGHFVVDLWTVQNHLTQLIPQQVLVELFAHHAHIFDFVDRADDSKAEEAIVRIVNEVLRIHHSVRKIINAHGNELSINPMLEVPAAEPRVYAFILALATFVNSFPVVRRRTLRYFSITAADVDG